jgi:hypothetical protein
MRAFGAAVAHAFRSRSNTFLAGVYAFTLVVPLVVGSVANVHWPGPAVFVRQALLLIPSYCLGFGTLMLSTYSLCSRSLACAEDSPYLVRLMLRDCRGPGALIQAGWLSVNHKCQHIVLEVVRLCPCSWCVSHVAFAVGDRWAVAGFKLHLNSVLANHHPRA